MNSPQAFSAETLRRKAVNYWLRARSVSGGQAKIVAYASDSLHIHHADRLSFFQQTVRHALGFRRKTPAACHHAERDDYTTSRPCSSSGRWDGRIPSWLLQMVQHNPARLFRSFFLSPGIQLLDKGLVFRTGQAFEKHIIDPPHIATQKRGGIEPEARKHLAVEDSLDLCQNLVFVVAQKEPINGLIKDAPNDIFPHTVAPVGPFFCTQVDAVRAGRDFRGQFRAADDLAVLFLHLTYRDGVRHDNQNSQATTCKRLRR